MKKYDLSKVMKRAWELKKENTKNIFSVCLQISWKEIKEGAKMRKEITKDYENNTLTLTTSKRQKAWLAEIVGTDEKYTFNRKFLNASEDGGRWLDFKLEDGKLYCWKEYDEQQFGVVEGGKLYEISKQDTLELINK